MPHKPPIQPGETVDSYLRRVEAEHAAGGNGLSEGIEGTPVIVNGEIIGWNIGGEFFTQEEVDALIATGKFPEEPSGPGRAPPSFASTQAAQTQAEEARAAQAELDRQAAKDAAALLAEQTERTTRLSSLTRLIESFLQQQSQARDTLANLQPDEFRFAAVAGGIAPFGVTPQQGFQKQLTATASAPVPEFDPTSTPSIESAIQQLTGVQPPTAPPGFGMARGGVIEMGKGADGSFSPLPTPLEASLVGEGRHGEGIAAGTAEVMIKGPSGVAIIPLQSRGMAEGGITGFPFDPIEFNKETLFPALGTSGIFGGFETVPTGELGRAGRLNLSQSRGRPFLESLGIRPSFVQTIGSSDVFFIDPTTGKRRLLGGGALKRVNPADIVRVQSAKAFGQRQGARLGGQEALGILSQVQDPSAFTRFSAPIREPTTGALLPAPFTVASELNKLRLTNPNAFNLLLSAYESAGVPSAAVLSTMQASLPFGQARTQIGLR